MRPAEVFDYPLDVNKFLDGSGEKDGTDDGDEDYLNPEEDGDDDDTYRPKQKNLDNYIFENPHTADISNLSLRYMNLNHTLSHPQKLYDLTALTKEHYDILYNNLMDDPRIRSEPLELHFLIQVPLYHLRKAHDMTELETDFTIFRARISNVLHTGIDMLANHLPQVCVDDLDLIDWFAEAEAMRRIHNIQGISLFLDISETHNGFCLIMLSSANLTIRYLERMKVLTDKMDADTLKASNLWAKLKNLPKMAIKCNIPGHTEQLDLRVGADGQMFIDYQLNEHESNLFSPFPLHRGKRLTRDALDIKFEKARAAAEQIFSYLFDSFKYLKADVKFHHDVPKHVRLCANVYNLFLGHYFIKNGDHNCTTRCAGFKFTGQEPEVDYVELIFPYEKDGQLITLAGYKRLTAACRFYCNNNDGGKGSTQYPLLTAGIPQIPASVPRVPTENMRNLMAAKAGIAGIVNRARL